MPRTPFTLTFTYVPKWKGNRKRESADQLSFVLRDLQERRRISEQEKIIKGMAAKDGDPDSEATRAKVISGEYAVSLLETKSELWTDLAERYVVSFTPFQVEDENGLIADIKTFHDLKTHCSDVVAEVAARLLNGPDADELKN